MRSRLAGFISEHPAVDLIAAAVIGWAVAHRHGFGVYLTPADQRSSLYAVLAEASLGLLGLVATALTILRAVGGGERIERLRLEYGSRITRAMYAALVGLAIVAGVGLWAQIADTKKEAPSHAVAQAIYAALVLLGIRLVRLHWTVRLILKVDEADTRDERQRRRRPALRLRTEEERDSD